MTATTTLKLAAGEGERADFQFLGNRFMIESATTDGRFALIEHTIAPRKLAAPTHTHANEDEYSFILSGRMGAEIGDEVVEAGPGDLVFKPRGIPHAFWNPGDEETHLLELISPGNFANYFEELAPVITQPGPPDFDKLAQIQQRYALEMDMGSIERLVAEHNLLP